MNSDRNDCPRISRRVALTGTALALGGAAATVISQATAQEKLSQADAKYALPTAERVQSRPRRYQPERLAPAIC
jgi:hypothetical protein